MSGLDFILKKMIFVSKGEYSMFRTNKIALQFIQCMLLVFVTTPALSALSLGYGIVNVEIGGDMDGVSSVSGGGSTEILPEQDDGAGTKISIGSYSNTTSFEFAIVTSDHDGSHVARFGPTQSDYLSLNFDWKFAKGEGDLKGMYILGFGFSSVKVKDGSLGGVLVDDAKFKGIDLRLGLGLRYRLTVMALRRLLSLSMCLGIN